MGTNEEIEEAREAIATKLKNSGFTDREVTILTDIIVNEYNGLPMGWLDLVDYLMEKGYYREDALNIVYLSFKAIRHKEE